MCKGKAVLRSASQVSANFRSLRLQFHGPRQAMTLCIVQIHVFLLHLLSWAQLRRHFTAAETASDHSTRPEKNITGDFSDIRQPHSGVQCFLCAACVYNVDTVHFGAKMHSPLMKLAIVQERMMICSETCQLAWQCCLTRHSIQLFRGSCSPHLGLLAKMMLKLLCCTWVQQHVNSKLR